MTGWAPQTAQVIDKGFGGSRGGDPINGVVIHHVAGTNGLSYVANANSRNSHPTYHIDRNGKVTGIVHPDRRPYSTAGRPDTEAVTFEIDNSAVGGNWPISDASLNALIDVIVWHALQSPRKGHGFAKNIPGKAQNEFFIAWHQQYVATACPGPYVISMLDHIVAQCRARYDAIVNPPKPPTPKPVWVNLPAPLTLQASTDIPVLDLVTGKTVGNAIKKGANVGNLVQDTTVNGLRYYRTAYSRDKGFDRGLLASSFVPVPPPAPTVWKVVFDHTPDDPTSDYLKVEVEDGKTVAKPPADPTREGFIFKGWYDGDTEYDFSKPVTGLLTLDALWEAIPAPDPEPETPSWFVKFIEGLIEFLTKFLAPKP